MSKVSKSIDNNHELLKEAFQNCYDVVFNRFRSGGTGIECLVAYIISITSAGEINKSIMEPLKKEKLRGRVNNMDDAKKLPVQAANALLVSEMDQSIQYMLDGYCLLFIEGSRNALAYYVGDDKGRKVDTAGTEISIKGPQQAFVERIGTNVALIRNILKTPGLKVETMNVGRLTATKVAVVYLEGTADREVVEEVKKRIASIDIDAVTDSSVVEFLIEDSPLSPFPQMQESEKPNVCCNELSEGRVAIIVDGSPQVLLVPAVFFNYLVTVDDNYSRFHFSTFLRFLRYLAFFTALLAPSVYIAVTTYHHEMIPTPLLIAIAHSRAEIPLPAILEAILMELVFELLREATVRLPKVLGPSVTVVGGLVIGQGAVEAGLVSQIMVIVVAITGISSYALPRYNHEISVRLLRFPMMILAAAFGMFGIIIGILLLVTHLSSLRSFGVPVLSPFAPLSFQDLKNQLVKGPVWTHTERPAYIKHENRRKIKKGARPKPPGKKGHKGDGGQ